MRTIALLVTLLVTVAATAEPPCQVKQVVVPHSIHAATIFHDTHLRIVEVPVPAFVFQTLTAYQPPAPQVVQTPVQSADGIGTDDMLQSLLGQPLQADPLGEISQKCASCHSLEKGTSKGGLALFDQNGRYSPTTRSGKQLTKANLAARARSTGSDAMPPGADTNPAKRLSDAAISFLEQ